SGQTTFSHDGFQQRVKVISQQIPYKSAAENIANNMGYSNPGEKAVEGWIGSPGHHKNMVGDYNLSGIGIAQNSEGTYYFNQIFIKTR
ncbi:MAG: CAP domain-containing protein, partial [Okeania sp. SIO2D1]|nr:CAP domain-containing protein [Okeania sp. SIO2D1]